MTFLHLGPNWVANTRRFTVQLADGERVVYSDGERRAVMRTDVSAPTVRLDLDALSLTVDEGSDAAAAADSAAPAVMSRIAAGLAAMSIPVECAPEHLDLVDLLMLLFDLESLGPSELVELADALLDAEAAWRGEVLEISSGGSATIRCDAITVDAGALAVELDRSVLVSLLDDVAGWALEGDAVTWLQLSVEKQSETGPTRRTPGAETSDLGMQGPATAADGPAEVVVTVAPPAGLPTRLGLRAGGEAVLEVVGGAATLRVGLDPLLALPFLLESESVTFDDDGNASHRVTLVLDGVEQLLDEPRTASELVLAIARGVAIGGVLAAGASTGEVSSS